MSDVLRVAVVAEGPTDAIVIEAALRAMIPARSIVWKLLQPEGSIAFGETGTGWGGVYRWCKQSALRGQGSLGRDELVLKGFDMLILHLDADVAGRNYAEAGIVPIAEDRELPCERPCPPAKDTTDELRSVLLSWCGEKTAPSNVVLCTPSKNTEAWVVTLLFPQDRAVRAAVTIECFATPESRLGQQPKKQRIRKSQHDYRAHGEVMQSEWPRIAAIGKLSEAHRFQQEVLAALATLGSASGGSLTGARPMASTRRLPRRRSR